MKSIKEPAKVGIRQCYFMASTALDFPAVSWANYAERT